MSLSWNMLQQIEYISHSCAIFTTNFLRVLPTMRKTLRLQEVRFPAFFQTIKYIPYLVNLPSLDVVGSRMIVPFSKPLYIPTLGISSNLRLIYKSSIRRSNINAPVKTDNI